MKIKIGDIVTEKATGRTMTVTAMGGGDCCGVLCRWWDSASACYLEKRFDVRDLAKS